MKAFAVIDRGDETRGVGPALRDATLFIVGSPLVSTAAIAAAPLAALEFADACGPPNEELPTYSVGVRLIETPEKTTMTITCRFASIADMEQLLATGKEEGMRLAVGQIDAIVATRTGS
jgi:hypothetical protein